MRAAKRTKRLPEPKGVDADVLEAYRDRRDFAKTPEPPPRRKAAATGNRFVVQKHRARQLHYDFRLEVDGVLRSWSVPKGPSLDPSLKRFAVAVEDHPLEYADFEGVIPEGEYGGGTVMVWDRGTFVPEDAADARAALEKGHLKFTMKGRKLKGSWVLVRMRGRDWLLMKHRDRYASTTDVTEAAPRSVVTRRTLRKIAAEEGGDEERAATGDPAPAARRRSAHLERAPGELVVGGATVRHPDKIWWPDEGITKGEIASFYDAVAPRALPWLQDRPLVAERCPDGMRGSCFFQKNFATGLPRDVPTTSVRAESTGKAVRYIVGGTKQTLLAMVNLGCIAIHMMNCRKGSLDEPDWLAFDLDPSSGDFADAARAGLHLRALLDDFGLHSYPKTSGARGLHVFVPLRSGPDQDAVRAFAREIGQRAAARWPKAMTTIMAKRSRGDRVFVDTMRNAFGQTIVAPFSVRRRPRAPVSTPLDWDEVRPSLDPATFNVRTMARRLAGPDPWADFWRHRQRLEAA